MFLKDADHIFALRQPIHFQSPCNLTDNDESSYTSAFLLTFYVGFSLCLMELATVSYSCILSLGKNADSSRLVAPGFDRCLQCVTIKIGALEITLTRCVFIPSFLTCSHTPKCILKATHAFSATHAIFIYSYSRLVYILCIETS